MLYNLLKPTGILSWSNIHFNRKFTKENENKNKNKNKNKKKN
jgi:hypothetical protein